VIWQVILGVLGGFAVVGIAGAVAAPVLEAAARREGAPGTPRPGTPAGPRPLEGARCEDDYLAREPPREREETGDAK
jgi:hypothetical protein